MARGPLCFERCFKDRPFGRPVPLPRRKENPSRHSVSRHSPYHHMVDSHIDCRHPPHCLKKRKYFRNRARKSVNLSMKVWPSSSLLQKATCTDTLYDKSVTFIIPPARASLLLMPARNCFNSSITVQILPQGAGNPTQWSL